MEKHMFLGWHNWQDYEVFGLFQEVAKDVWWFFGPGEGMSFKADMAKTRRATREEIEQLIDFDD